MAQLIDIPNVGQVEFPDDMTTEAISIAAKRLHDESVQPQVPSAIPIASATQLPPPEQVKLPDGNEALKQQSERFNQAFLSGALSLPAQALQAQQQFEEQIPVIQEARRQGITPPPTLSEQALSAMPQPLSQALTFQPENLSETGVQIGGGAFSPEAPLLSADDFAKAKIQPISNIPTKVIAGHVDDPTIAPMLRESLETAIKEQADIEKQLTELPGIDLKIRAKKPRQELQSLQVERKELLHKMKMQRDMQADITATSDKLRDNLIKQQNVKSAVTSSKIPVVDQVDFNRTFGSKSTPEMIHDMAIKRVDDLDVLVEQGVLAKERVPFIRQAVYDETLKANGIKVKSEKLSKYNILGELFRWGEVQRKTGVATGEAAQNLIIKKTAAQNYQNEQLQLMAQANKAAKKAGLNPATILEDLQYFRTQADGSVRFDPSELHIPGKVAIPPTFKQYTPQQQEVLAGIRQALDSTADDLQLPKLPGYIPLREKPQFATISTKTSADALRNPALAKARTSGLFDPSIHETDFMSVMERYGREASRKKFTGPALEEGIRTLNQLQMSSLDNEAIAFKKYLLEMLNINGEKEAAEILGTHKLGQIKPDLDAFVNMLPDPQGSFEQIRDAVSRAMYSNLIGIKPKAWVKQWLQAPVMGSIELGPKWWASGASDMVMSPKRRAGAQKILKASLLEDVGQLEEQVANQPTNVVAKIIDFINKPGGAIAKRTISAGENANRLQTVLGAQNKFEAAWSAGREAAIDRLLKESALTTAQRSLISRAYIAGNMENARDMYALIITQRVNFTYSVADKPELLRGTLGQLFPFTTYPRNVLARTAEAYVEGKPIQIIKQIAYPLALLASLEMLAGRALPSGSMPVEAIADVATRGVSPTPAIVAESPVQTLTPLPRGLVKFDMKRGLRLDPDAAKKAILRDLEVFPEIKDSPSELYKGIGKVLGK